MVVLSAGILTKGGKTLVARQFVEMSRSRVEGLLSAFPKLIGNGSEQHTVIETEAIRYVYQPLEKLYLVLVTNKQSNILEDIETLKLLTKIVPEFCMPISEETVKENNFELIFAFDEAVSEGNRESISLHQIKTNIEMDSHEERLSDMVRVSKEKDAKDEMKRRAEAIAKAKAKNGQSGGFGGRLGSMAEGFAGGFGSSSSSGMGGMSSQDEVYDASVPRIETFASSSGPSSSFGKSAGGSGMTFKKKESTSNDFLAAMKAEGDIMDTPSPVSSGPSAISAAAAQELTKESIHVGLEEKLRVRMDRNGGLDLELSGEAVLSISDSHAAACKVGLSLGDNPHFSFKTHPKIDKKVFADQSALCTTGGRPFPVNSSLPVLKWRMNSKDESASPFTVTCWPSDDGATVEYELHRTDLTLSQVEIVIPVPSQPQVQSGDGNHVYNGQALVWSLDMVDESNANGSIEFTIDGHADEASFFPVKASFTAPQTMCAIQVTQAALSASGANLPFSTSSRLVAGDYELV